MILLIYFLDADFRQLAIKIIGITLCNSVAVARMYGGVVRIQQVYAVVDSVPEIFIGMLVLLLRTTFCFRHKSYQIFALVRYLQHILLPM